MKNQQTEHRYAYVLMYLSYHRKQDLLPYYLDEVYDLYHHRKQRRNISYPALSILSCKYQLPDAGNELGLVELPVIDTSTPSLCMIATPSGTEFAP